MQKKNKKKKKKTREGYFRTMKRKKNMTFHTHTPRYILTHLCTVDVYARLDLKMLQLHTKTQLFIHILFTYSLIQLQPDGKENQQKYLVTLSC